MAERKVDPRPVVQRFAMLMEDALLANDHKTGWLDIQPDELMELLDRKVEKLREAIYQRVTGEMDAEDFERKSANVANFAMMVVDRVEWGIGNKR